LGFIDANGDELFTVTDVEKSSFDDMQDLWSEHLESEPFRILERVLDAPMRDIHGASDE
jgi:hypothetical protein